MQGTIFFPLLVVCAFVCVGARACVCVCVWMCVCVCVCVCVYTGSVQESACASKPSATLVSFYRRVIWLNANVDCLACAASYNSIAYFCPTEDR